MMFDFVDGSAGSEFGTRRNEREIERIQLQPRVLVNVENRRLDTTILGKETSLPFGIAPMGMCDLTWPGADRMLAAAAVQHEIPLCVSSAASTTLEEMHRLTGGKAWFQLYVGQSREAAFDLVDRAAGAGYEFLVLTVDTPQVSRRIRDLKNGFQVPFRMGPRQFLDFACHPRWSLQTLMTGVPKPMNFETAQKSNAFARSESRGGTDWRFLDALRNRWNGKLIIKGVMSPDDAVGIRDAGADAVYVSNHGGRQLDSAPAAIHALPQIRAAIGTDTPLIFDSGLRSGEDIVKALALGADFVMLGRPLIYAIGADGARGLDSLIDYIAEDISITLAQIGRKAIGELDASVLADPTLLPPAPDSAPESGNSVIGKLRVEGR